MGKRQYNVIGLMSGTSLDGIDAAMLQTNGERVFKYGATAFRPYSVEEKQVLSAVTQSALAWNFKGPPPNGFAHAEQIITNAHIEAVKLLKKQCSEDIDLIGFHGQTVLHRPPVRGKNGQTLQLGDGQKLADALGINVVGDFRSADMASGGQGAPLAPIYHQSLLSRPEIKLPAAVLNIGGVSNVTVLGGGILSASDCGPGNGPLDSWVLQNGAGDFDKDGLLSLAGVPNFALIENWLKVDFFKKPVPKSADRWDFDVLADMAHLPVHDGAATLAAFTAMAISDTTRQYEQRLETIIVCGGGRKNPAIMAALKEQNIGRIISAEQAGFRGDDLEAEAFAFLAARSVRGLVLSMPETTGAPQPQRGGVLFKPDNG